MSDETKPRGGGKSELTRFKILWRDSLSESARDYWRALFVSTTTQAEVRKQIATKLKVNLSFDKQLTQFRKWLNEQDSLDDEAERQADDERRLKTAHPDWDAERLRSEVISASYRRTLATGDFKLGLRTVVQDLNVQKVTLDRAKFEFDATRAALAKLPQLKAIATNKELSDDQKLEQARLALFGSAPQ